MDSMDHIGVLMLTQQILYGMSYFPNPQILLQNTEAKAQ